MSDLIQEFRQEHILVQDTTQIAWCVEQFNKAKGKLIKLLQQYDCDVEGFPDYMRELVNMADIKAYPSIRLNEAIAKDFHKYHTLVYQIYDQHYHP